LLLKKKEEVFNQLKSFILIQVMQENNVFNFVFSSSATVYGTPRYLPLDEDHSVIGYEVTNPYGKSKYMVEHVLADLCKSDSVRFNFFFVEIYVLK
jgi:UDP-glucose 4-epimerase